MVPCMVPWPHPSPCPKRHLDRFTVFAGLTIVTDDKQITLLRIYVVLQCGLIMNRFLIIIINYFLLIIMRHRSTT